MTNGRWFTHELRVRYQETDQMGVVYHANYLNWFEIGRTEMVRELGMPYQSIESQGLLLPVIDLEMKFVQPAKYDELIRIHTAITAFSPVRLEFSYEIRRTEADNLLVTGATRHMWVNKEFKPARIDKASPGLYTMIEATAQKY